MNSNISFIQLIKKHSIRIPKIQRDYAQGRTDEKTIEIRNHFLEEMFDVLNAGNNTPLILDFVYGSTSENSTVFIPLDGQQRLTTLFLLHWYLLPDNEKTLLRNENESTFTYETRTSSKDFCNELVYHSLKDVKRETDEEWKLSDRIKDASWFQWSWRKDPTIIGMLTMLDTMDEIVGGKTEDELTSYWKGLTEGKIAFHLLPLEKFGLTDDLYVKMNARGKELSQFDILKSTMEEQMKKKKDNEEAQMVNEEIQNKWRTRIDSEWMDLFWDQKAKPYLSDVESEEGESKVVGKIEFYYLRFLKRMMYFHLFIIDDFDKPEQLDKKQFQEGIKSVREYVRKNDLLGLISPLSKCGFFNESFFIFVINTMEKMIYKEDSITKNISELSFVKMWSIDNKPVDNLFDLFIDDTITYLGRVLFFAQMQFSQYHCAKDVAKDESLTKEFNDWMRVIRNLAYNTTYNDIGEFIDTLRALKVLSENVYKNNPNGTIRTYLKNNGKIDRFYGEQIKEEIEKARQIICEGSTWEAKIKEAENYAFFKGSIRFLYRTDDDQGVDWEIFDTRFRNAQVYFDETGVKDSNQEKYRTDAILLKTFISQVKNPWEHLWWNKEVFSNSSYNWKSLLTNSSFRQIMNTILSGNLSASDIDTEEWHKKLYQSNLLTYIVNKMDNARVRDIHGHKAIYPPRIPGIVLDMETRDNILSQLKSDNEIEIDNWHIIDRMPFLIGWDINFKLHNYENYKFQWYRDGKIYLLDHANEYIIKDDEYVYFEDPESKMQKDDYIAEFEKLIQRVK